MRSISFVRTTAAIPFAATCPILPGPAYRKPIVDLALRIRILIGKAVVSGVSLDLLRSFLTVYRAGSVSAAADLLGLAQPTVTAHVKILEADLERPCSSASPAA